MSLSRGGRLLGPAGVWYELMRCRHCFEMIFLIPNSTPILNPMYSPCSSSIALSYLCVIRDCSSIM
jgi:hypothetical protein